MEQNQLEAVINLPSGVFKPYAGVATAILIFTKGGATQNVWFYDLANDGYSLDDKRNPISQNDLPHLVSSWQHYRKQAHMPVGNFIGHQLSRQLATQFPNNEHLKDEGGAERDYQDRTQKAFIVPKAEIAAQKYDLSINRYKEVIYQEESYEAPKIILGKLKTLETDILADLVELEKML